MCSTTLVFFPRSAVSSASCSPMPASRAASSASTVAASARASDCVEAPTMSRLAGISLCDSALSSAGRRRLFASSASSPFTLASNAFCADTPNTCPGAMSSIDAVERT